MHNTHPIRGSLKMHGAARRFFFFDKAYLKHPKVIPNQVYREILTAAGSIPVMSFLTAIVFWYEVRGYSKLYDGFQRGVAFEFFSIGAFLVFTDFCIYWIHRALHWPIFYGPIHKQHHLWKVPTPWASHAFHPLDGFAQSTPYHIYAFLFPMNKLVYLGMFVFVNMWTISIHDGNFISKDGVINSAAHHAEHHLHFTCNYGQYFTWWDRIFGTHREPDFPALDPRKVSHQLCRPRIGQKAAALLAYQTDTTARHTKGHGQARSRQGRQGRLTRHGMLETCSVMLMVACVAARIRPHTPTLRPRLRDNRKGTSVNGPGPRHP